MASNKQTSMDKTEILQANLEQMAVKRLRVEAVVEELIANGFCRVEEIVVYPEMSSVKFFERDVLSVEPMLNQLGGMDWLKIETPRDGLYDTLPERLFHQPSGRVKNNDVWEEIRAEEERQEAEARQFFLPFDNALYHQRIKIEQFEKQALAGQDEGFLKEFLEIFWPDYTDLKLNAHQKASLFQITTLAYKAAGNLAEMQACYEQMLGQPVSLSYEDFEYELPVATSFRGLGEAGLGVDFVTVSPSLTDDSRRLKVSVGPLSAREMEDYVPNAKNKKLVDFLGDMLVPIEMDWRLELLSEEKKAGFQLSTSGAGALLGFTTVL